MKMVATIAIMYQEPLNVRAVFMVEGGGLPVWRSAVLIIVQFVPEHSARIGFVGAVFAGSPGGKASPQFSNRARVFGHARREERIEAHRHDAEERHSQARHLEAAFRAANNSIALEVMQ